MYIQVAVFWVVTPFSNVALLYMEMEAAKLFETSVSYHVTTRCHISDDHKLRGCYIFW
jgi:hypothetical protein